MPTGDLGRQRPALRLLLPDHDTYRRVLTICNGGQSLLGIAKLDAEGVPTSRGGTWHASTIKRDVTSETAKRIAA